jgi:hypothetical protein
MGFPLVTLGPPPPPRGLPALSVVAEFGCHPSYMSSGYCSFMARMTGAVGRFGPTSANERTMALFFRTAPGPP